MYDIVKTRKKEKEAMRSLMAEAPSMDYIYLPNLSFKASEFPDIKDMKVGDEYELKIKVKMTSYSENKSLNAKQESCRADFDVEGVELIDDGEDKTL